MPVQAVTGHRDAGRPPVLRAPRFTGRELELAAVADALAAGPAVVLVEGEAGVGKSRLVRELLASEAAWPHRPLVAVCPPFRQPFTLGPVVDALRQATGNVAGLRLSALAGALRPLFPEWADDLPPAPEPLDDASAARHRLFRALAELLTRLGAGLLVVEDMHWADEATLEFLLYLASRPAQRISLLVTYRPDDVPDGSPLRRLSSPLPGGAARARICLQPLDAAGTASLMSSMLDDEEVSAGFAGLVQERTGGLPLAVEESVRLLYDSGQLIRHAGQWERRDLAELDVPPTVRDSVLDRTARLSPSAQTVLRAAAVLTDPVSEQILATVAGLAARRARSGLLEALGSGLLREDPPGLLAFGHVLACRAVYEAVPAPERRRLHLRAAHALERESPPPVARLARHFQAAGETGEWCRYAEQAADIALSVADDATAATVLHDLVARAALPSGVMVRLIRKIPLVGLPGRACLGDLVGCLRSAVEDNALTPVERAQARGQLGRCLVHGGNYLEGFTELERAVPDLETHHPAEAVGAMVRLGFPDHAPWPAAVHRQWLDRAAMTMGSLMLSRGERMEFTVTRATALLILGEPTGWEVAARIPYGTATAQEVQYVSGGCLNIGSVAMLWGRYDEARRRLTAGLELTTRHEYPLLGYMLKVTAVRLDWFTGAWDGLAQRIAALGAADYANPREHALEMLVSGLLGAAAGDRAAEDTLRVSLREARRHGDLETPLEPAAALARLRLAEGRAREALALTEEPMGVITAKRIWLWATDIAPVRVRALTAVGRCEEAARLVAAFARGLRGRDASAPRAALATCRAILAEGQGHARRAARLFARAGDAWQALPRPYDALLAREQQARCLLAIGEGEAGLALLQDVFDSLAALGARSDAVRVMRTLGDHGVQTRRPWWGSRGYGGQLSPREHEVVALLAVGRSTREIARVLSRSPKTVDAQLASAMRKLGVTTRTALVASAVAAGMAADARPAPPPERFGTPRKSDSGISL